MKLNNPKSKLDNLITLETNKELLIYNVLTHQTFCLNQPLAIVWELADGNNSLSDIKQKLSERLSNKVTEEYILLALDQLKRENLIEPYFEFSDSFINLPRREIIKKIGISTMIALPLISTLIAPTAAQSASSPCLVSGQACTISSECCSTNTTNLESPPGTVVATFTGSCCRNGSGLYGANQTCVPGNNGDFIPPGYVTWNGTTRAFGGTISCF